MSVAVGVGYEFATSDDLNWGGFCQALEQAQQECGLAPVMQSSG